MMNDKTLEQTILFTQMVAHKQGWLLNPDKDFYDTLVEGLMKNYNRYGYFFCPCRDAEARYELDKPAICPCIWSKPDIAEFGHCYCALYLSREFVAGGKTPRAIPDRRFAQA
jgi:ferredoxin-thioredoxin reductase catalytic subunit